FFRVYAGCLSFAVLFVAHLFHPVDDLAIERFLNGDVCHCRGWRGAMPMFLVRRKRDDIPRTDFFDRATLALRSTAARCHDQGLPQRMRVPRGASTGLKRHTRPGRAGWSFCLE